jgi:hypothetical protein
MDLVKKKGIFEGLRLSENSGWLCRLSIYPVSGKLKGKSFPLFPFNFFKCFLARVDH